MALAPRFTSSMRAHRQNAGSKVRKGAAKGVIKGHENVPLQ
jgi:hypothetical protein